jgi:thioredoxin 1
MPIAEKYLDSEPSTAEIRALAGPLLLEFGSPSCGLCRRAQPLIAAAFADHPQVRHIKIADASGRPLGRSFGVKLWPTLIFLVHGKESERLVRPTDSREIGAALARLEAHASL